SELEIARLKAPAGLDLGAVTPDEIAASIMAELVLVRRRGSAAVKESGQLAEGERLAEQVGTVATTIAIDPVCGMEVEIASARHSSSFEGDSFYFCCPACKRLFDKNPQEYLLHSER